MAIEQDQLRGHLDALVLAVLQAGEAHGYEVLKRLELRGHGELHLREGTLYPALYRLEDAGYLKSRVEKKTAGRGRPRRVYALTACGKRQLKKKQEEFRTFASVLGGILEGAG